MLEIKDLYVNYGAVHALNGVSMTVKDGEIVSLIGANGAGKTTTLRTITGLEKAASGSITFDGHDLRKIEPSKIITLKLAHVPEGRHIFPQMTVEENLEMGAFTDQTDMARTMADVYERFPRLKERKRQLAGTLSGALYVMILVGGGDADLIARAYGTLCKYYYPLKGMILNGMKVDNFDDYIQPDFLAERTEFEFQLIASINVKLILKVGFKAVFIFIKNLIINKKSIKGDK